LVNEVSLYYDARSENIRPNNILTHFNLIILWNYNFNSFNSKNLRNLARHNFWNSLRMTQSCRNMREWTSYKKVVLLYIILH